MVGRAWIVLIVLAAACGTAVPATSANPTIASSIAPATPSAKSAIDQIKARGTLIVAVRQEAPNPPSKTMGDPAHAQKRAFEVAVATMVASAIFGPAVKVQFQNQGGDRIGLLASGVDLAMVTSSPASSDRALISPSYAANSVVVAAKDGGAVARIEDLAGKNVGVAQDELVTKDLAQQFFQQKSIAPTLDSYQGMFGASLALDDGKAVAVVGDGIGVAILAGERKLKVVGTVAQRPYVIAVRQDAKDLAAAVNAALQDALKSGAIKDAATRAGFPYTAP